MLASEICTRAAQLVGGDRQVQHGDKVDNFNKIAVMWNAWGLIKNGQPLGLDAHDVGVMMALLKIARTQSGALNADDYVDAAGYVACAGQVAHELA